MWEQPVVGQQDDDFTTENLLHLTTGHRDEELGSRRSRQLAAQSVERFGAPFAQSRRLDLLANLRRRAGAFHSPASW